MIHDFERAAGPWHLEWIAIPEAFAHCSAALGHTAFMLCDIQVCPENMKRNLDSTRGLIVAEAVMMALAPFTERVSAHDLVYAGCRKANEFQISLFDALIENEKIEQHLGEDKLRDLTNSANYLGSAQEMVSCLLDN